MFGLGKPAPESAVVNLVALQLKGLGITQREALANATQLVEKVLAEIRPRGIDPFKSDQGNEYATRQQFMTPRLAAGLTIKDITSHWNRPILGILCEVKMREMANFIVINVADQQGKDLAVAADHYKKTFVRYGDPTAWDPTDKFNAGLRQVDADLFPEFSSRVETWRNGVTELEVNRLIDHHGTLNAAIRHLVSTKSL